MNTLGQITSTAVALDHLVIAASSLAQGVQWCEATLGITPGPGGVHTKMGTHNRLFSVAGHHWPGVYAEIIAIDPTAKPLTRRRWFGLDESAMQAAVAHQPLLVHAVLRTTNLTGDSATWRKLGRDPGPVIAMSRVTATGELHWRLTVPDSGELAEEGCLPTLIEWPEGSPGWRLPASGVELLELSLLAPNNSTLPASYAAIGWQGVGVERVMPNERHRWRARFHTPKGVVSLLSDSPG
jgi:hypothetical protein